MPDGGRRSAGTAARVRSRMVRRRRLRLLGLIGLVFAAGLVAAWFLWIRDSSLFEIRDVRLIGLEQLPVGDEGGTGEATEVSEAVERALAGMTTVNVDREAIERAVEPYPRVERVTVETDFPNAATARFELRQEAAVVGEGSTGVVVSSDGTVLGPAEGEAEAVLPAIEGDPPPDGERAVSGRQLAQARVLGAVPKAIRPFTVGSAHGEDGVEVELSNGLVLLFGDDTRAGQKWKAATTVIADPEMSGATSVDLTVPWRPAVE